MLMLIEADKRGTEFSVTLTYAENKDDTFFIFVVFPKVFKIF